ncbi:GntR family transcriptional regulator [Streptomyces sp. NPDC058867]|uniref:GntR family transcriptional regulator n=1 Tax=unclassified Streptomyces TaxID=2593676 RepID=UPI0036922AC8
MPRTPAVRDSRRHQWERDRAHCPPFERAAPGTTEYDTGLSPSDLVLRTEHGETEAGEESADAFGVHADTSLLRHACPTCRTPENAPRGPVNRSTLREPIAAHPDQPDSDQPKPDPGCRRTGLPVPTPHEPSRPSHQTRPSRQSRPSRQTPPGDRTELLFTTDPEGW